MELAEVALVADSSCCPASGRYTGGYAVKLRTSRRLGRDPGTSALRWCCQAAALRRGVPAAVSRPFPAVQHVAPLAGGAWRGSGFRKGPGGPVSGIRRFCGSRKDLERPGKTSVRGCEDCEAAPAEVHACRERLKVCAEAPAGAGAAT